MSSCCCLGQTQVTVPNLEKKKASGVQSKGHDVKFSLLFIFMLFKNPSIICAFSQFILFISVISNTTRCHQMQELVTVD